MRTRFGDIAAAAFLLFAGCADSGGVSINEEVSKGDGGVTDIWETTELAAAETIEPTKLTEVDDSSTTDTSISCDGPGCPWTECSENSDCLSNLCMMHMGDFFCSEYCVEDCPPGWSCRQLGGTDPVFACVSDFSHLCLPCEDSSDCSSEGDKNACIIYEGIGTFCGGRCDSNKPCPEGFSCVEAASVEGVVTKTCVADSGECKCSKAAVKAGLSTPCVVTNEYGSCTGRRVCTPEGLAPCDAKTPAPETCNGLDDNCDGKTDENSCDDENSCTDDLCDPASGCKHIPLSGVPCDDGDKCTNADTCENGVCIGKLVKCNDGNPCTDDLCDEMTGCQFVPNSEECDDGDPCTIGDRCKDGICLSGPSITCDDGNPCTDDSCDAENGGCIYSPNSSKCDDSNPCTTGDHCAGGKCMFTGFLDCSDDNPCTTDLCDPSVGCVHQNNTVPCDDNSLCTIGDKCTDGVCQPGKMVDCDDGNPCTDDSCNSLVGCVHTNNTAPCDDFDPCTETDLCSGGMCVGTGLKTCDDGNPCTDDFCVPMAGCSHKPNSAPCSDNSVCTVGDVCVGGTCVPGDPLKCDDGNPCTKDSCDAIKGCVFVPTEGPCDDMNACTLDDHCEDGKCVSSQSADCDDENPCTTDICLPQGGCNYVANNASCDDGDPCTMGDFCLAGKCVSGPAMECDDGNVCTADLCVDGICKHSPVDGECDDKNPCTTVDTCHEGVCIGSQPLDCFDGNVCTTDYCDPAQGCVHLLNNAPCDDSNPCTIMDHCENGVCSSGGLLKCDDGNPCTDDSCQPEQGCVFTPNNAQCDDGNECTAGDHCVQGVCTAETLVPCDDGNPCTTDLCIPTLGCLHSPVDGPCSDGNACTVNDMCSDGTCVSGAPLDCDDGNPCTIDICDPDDGCQHTPAEDGAACDDGNACTSKDLCISGKCLGTQVLSCDDKDKCTTDSCDPLKGCVNDPIIPCCGNGKVEAGEECDDGNTNNGDGCDASCKNENPCPPEAAYVANYCWVKAIFHQESHSAACSRIGKSATPEYVNVGGWSEEILKQVASKWGFSSVGVYSCCAHSMWCNNSSKQCGTHGFGGDYLNFGPYSDVAWWPVYTCYP